MRPVNLLQKVCTKCGAKKPTTSFHKGDAKYGRVVWCKPCANAHRKRREVDYYNVARTEQYLKSNYGLTSSSLNQMLEDQGFCCAACGDELVLTPRTGKYHIDHCHTTGKVRGALCRNCNIALGHLKDDPVRIAALGRYITRTQ